jgi:hypothetical protein
MLNWKCLFNYGLAINILKLNRYHFAHKILLINIKHTIASDLDKLLYLENHWM